MDHPGSPIKVAVDTSPIYVTKAGVARYVHGILDAFQKLNPPDFDIHSLAWKVENHDFAQPQRAFRTLYREMVWANMVAPQLITQGQFSILHSMGVPIINTPRSARHVVTLHDLAPIRHPERFRRWHKAASQRGFQKTIHADKVICISQFTADEAMNLIGLPHEKIVVIHQASDWCDKPPSNIHPPPFALPDDFFLFVGTLEPGKNLQLLRDTYSLALDSNIHLPPLIVVGVRREGVQAESPAPALSSWIYTGRIPDNQLAWLYANAKALLFPSIYEGFGIPIVEAMILKCPVICSRTSSLPEVANDAALYAELNPASFLAAIQLILKNPILRQELVDAGKSRAANFSWMKNARQVLDLYSHL